MTLEHVYKEIILKNLNNIEFLVISYNYIIYIKKNNIINKFLILNFNLKHFDTVENR
jgi:hypothetical protein